MYDPQIKTVDLGLSREQIETHLRTIGYWNDSAHETRYRFVLSPSALVLSPRLRSQLERAASAAYTAIGTLSATLSRYARERHLTHEEARFLKMATSRTSGLFSPREIDGAIPPAIKIDFVISSAGDLRIAEVDAYNPRGFAYLGLLDAGIPPGFCRVGSGIKGLAALLRDDAVSRGAPWLILVSEHERFYAQSYAVLAGLLAREGINVTLLQEDDKLTADIFSMRSGAASDILCIPSGLGNVPLREYLLGRCAAGMLNPFYPPAAYLGSKAFLPFLSDEPGMGEFVPRSYLVHKGVDPRSITNGTPMVLKGVMSSGLKQIVFSDIDCCAFERAYSEGLRTKYPQWVMQEKVEQRRIVATIFDDQGTRSTREYCLRLTAYASRDGLLGAEVTGRPDEKVHGAPDCIQIPVVLG